MHQPLWEISQPEDWRLFPKKIWKEFISSKSLCGVEKILARSPSHESYFFDIDYMICDHELSPENEGKIFIKSQYYDEVVVLPKRVLAHMYDIFKIDHQLITMHKREMLAEQHAKVHNVPYVPPKPYNKREETPGFLTCDLFLEAVECPECNRNLKDEMARQNRTLTAAKNIIGKLYGKGCLEGGYIEKTSVVGQQQSPRTYHAVDKKQMDLIKSKLVSTLCNGHNV